MKRRHRPVAAILENSRISAIPESKEKSVQNQFPVFAIAPMMDWTDRHCRALHRLFSPHIRLYTEMVTTGAIIHGPRERLLGYGDTEHPVALQLGGSEPQALAACARIGADYGYDEINLNCGCPSDRVQNGAFGACLMREPDLVAECVASMKAVVGVPVTVKCRIGVDDQEPREALWAMASKVRAAGADELIVHARKAWLQGLSPKENRDVPPLDYALVYALKREFPDFSMQINGGIGTLAECKIHLEHLEGVMLGRAAYQNPGLMLDVDRALYGAEPAYADAFEIVEAYEPYIAHQLEAGIRLSDMTRHMLGLFAGMPGARAWRRSLSTHAVRQGAGLEVLHEALAHVKNAATDASAAA
ncbi:MAG: tRNA dihydrouridine(20/20a) synthase DusA [Hyphomicrobiales bacterium]|nr:tRNA dihydrouridine(20/20a) synthase DusA [Hyphomicrobiales bacterium]